MRFIRFAISVLILNIAGISASAQIQKCLTPTIQESSSFESWLTDVQSSRANLRLAAIGSYEIPVVVHVIHNGEAQGTGSNIPFQQVQSQFVVLNEDFKRLNADTLNTPVDFIEKAGKMDITFLPALENDTGVPLSEPGINRVDRNSMSFTAPPYTSAYIESTIKPATIWDPDRFFNIWVMDFSEALGYATPPVAALPDLDPTGNAMTDGIVVRYKSFGTTGNLDYSRPEIYGRTATHETGHWLGLYHVWGQSPDNACGEDDYVTDTPNQDEPTFFCPETQGPACPGIEREMWENYMDYTWDECMNLFTSGQVERMIIVIENAPRRKELLSSTVGGKYNQEITFSALENVQFNDPVFDLAASSNSGLTVDFVSSDIAVATISGTTVTIVGTGTTTITAIQLGDYLFEPAVTVEQVLTVEKDNQTITFEEIPILIFGNDPNELTGIASSGLEVSFSSSDQTIANITETSMLEILKAGEVTITASQPGNDNYNPAPSLDQTIDIQKASQNISFGPLDPVIYGGSDFLLDGTSNSSLEVKYLSTNTSVATLSEGQVSVGNAGETIIKAYQDGNENFLAADTVEQKLVVNKADQVVEFDSIPAHSYGDSEFVLSARSSVELPVTFESSDSTIISLSDSIAEILGAGDVWIKAIQEGNENYNSAVVSQMVEVKKAIQEWMISGVQDYQDTIEVIPLEISLDSGFPPVYVSISGPVEYENNIWTNTGSGRVSISVKHPGNELYESTDTIVEFCLKPTPIISEDTINYKLVLYSKKYPDSSVWILPDSTILTGDSIIVNQTGIYTLFVEFAGCSSITTFPVDSLITGIKETLQDLGISVYPNPSKDFLTLEFTGQYNGFAYYSFSDATGRQVTKPSKIGFPSQKIDINHIPPGVYFLHILIDEMTFSLRFVKE